MRVVVGPGMLLRSALAVMGLPLKCPPCNRHVRCRAGLRGHGCWGRRRQQRRPWWRRVGSGCQRCSLRGPVRRRYSTASWFAYCKVAGPPTARPRSQGNDRLHPCLLRTPPAGAGAAGASADDAEPPAAPVAVEVKYRAYMSGVTVEQRPIADGSPEALPHHYFAGRSSAGDAGGGAGGGESLPSNMSHFPTPLM